MEEWTKAEIGVGAAIADGSHVINGNCALFVIAAIMIKKEMGREDWKLYLNEICFNIEFEIKIMINISPKRFVIMVIVPEAIAFLFW